MWRTSGQTSDQAEKADIASASSRAEANVGRACTRGRYHRPHDRTLAQDYEVEEDEVLGSGANGEVWVVRNRQTGAKFAAKAYELVGITALKCKEIETEVEILLTVDHPHLARLVDVYETHDYLTLVMEILEGGELFDRIADAGHFSERDAAEALWQMLLAIKYIHGLDIVHRDLKLENWLYEKKDGNHLKLIDFGLSKFWQPSKMMEFRAGTLNYMAPEVLQRSYTSKCDLWSLGVIAYTLLVGNMPFTSEQGDEAMLQCIQEGKYTMEDDVWRSVSPKAKDFVRQLLTVDVAQRLTAEQALGHAWIADREVHAQTHVNQDVVNALCSFSKASAFRRACMSVMAWSLSNEERAEVRDAFLEIDKDHSGKITLGELKSVLEEKFHVEDEEVMRTFEALHSSSSRDEAIHYSDFLAAMVSTRIALHDDLLKSAFCRFDTDNTGFITAEKLHQLLGDSLDVAEAEQVVKEADSNHDGSISMDEFIQYLRGRSAADRHKEAVHRVIDRELQRPAAAVEAEPKKAAYRKRLRSSIIVKKAKAPLTLQARVAAAFARVANICRTICGSER